MRVRMLARVAGPEGNWGPGEMAEVPERFGKALVAGGYASAAPMAREVEEKDEPEVKTPAGGLETAALETPEKAVRPKLGFRRRG